LVLLKPGIIIKESKEGLMPLHFLAKYFNNKSLNNKIIENFICVLIKDHRLNLNIKLTPEIAPKQQSPLHLAARYQNSALLFHYFVKYGANLKLLDKDNHTALHYVAYNQTINGAQELISYITTNQRYHALLSIRNIHNQTPQQLARVVNNKQAIHAFNNIDNKTPAKKTRQSTKTENLLQTATVNTTNEVDSNHENDETSNSETIEYFHGTPLKTNPTKGRSKSATPNFKFIKTETYQIIKTYGLIKIRLLELLFISFNNHFYGYGFRNYIEYR